MLTPLFSYMDGRIDLLIEQTKVELERLKRNSFEKLLVTFD
jgi:hypothetical protein